MTSFLVIAALLGVLVFALLLRPLWAHERLVALTVGVLALASAGLLYQLVGTPRALDPAIVRGPQTLAEGIAQLEAALREHPDQTEGWVLLARAYQSEGRTAQARDALDKAAKLAPNDPDILVEAAQARANADPERHFDAPAVALLQSALQANPAHQRARWFLGVWQRQSGQNAQAAAAWTPLLDQVDARTASSLREQINLAREDAGLSPLPSPAAPKPLITAEVALDPSLAARLPASARIFVIARQVGGSPIPVAAQKHAIGELPLTVALSDADSPMPNLKLSQVRQIELSARVSLDGTASPAPDAPASATVQVTLPASAPVRLLIKAR
ncbi:MAG: tetratricopeptide repeat protein [Proteobacteria bacterium]|nr:tetratricopeptide repeat protein [Pseudomonadota bacterium]